MKTAKLWRKLCANVWMPRPEEQAEELGRERQRTLTGTNRGRGAWELRGGGGAACNRLAAAVVLALSAGAAAAQTPPVGSLHSTVLDGVQVEYFVPQELKPVLTADGKTLLDAVPVAVYIANPVRPTEPIRMPAPKAGRGLAAPGPEADTASFSITYIASGDTDAWGQPCVAFPAQAQAAFNAAAAIWAGLVRSPVPITIRAGWASLSGGTLGYSGGGTLHRDFAGAPRPATWYGAALANSLAGSDLASTEFDMHITYNQNFSWYFGTDGNTPAGLYDFMSVVLHEIAHGLNFAGSMSYSSGQGSWGYGSGYPTIYDTFARDGAGTPLLNTTTYPNPSAALGSALTSMSVWFHGPSAMAANGGQRVKLYAPSTWTPGSSYSHLDYSTFTGTTNRLMVYALSSGSSVHDPGPVTRGLLTDVGWLSGDPNAPVNFSAISASSSRIDLAWGKNTSGNNVMVAWSSSGTFGTPSGTYSVGAPIAGGGTVLYNGSATSLSHTGLTAGTKYYYKAWSVLSGPTYSSGITCSATTTPAVPFTEGFENAGALPAGWTQEYVTGAVPWVFQSGGYIGYPAAAHGGSYNAFLFYAVSSEHKTKLVTPPIDFGTRTRNPQLTFWHCMPVWVLDQDELRVFYKTFAGGSWNLLATYSTSVASWTQRTLSLPSPTSTYYLAFEGNAKYGYGVCVDDVAVTADIEPPKVSISRNGGMITITWPSGVLQQADNVGGPYSDVSGASSPYTTTPSGLRKFYRVR